MRSNNDTHTRIIGAMRDATLMETMMKDKKTRYSINIKEEQQGEVRRREGEVDVM